MIKGEGLFILFFVGIFSILALGFVSAATNVMLSDQGSNVTYKSNGTLVNNGNLTVEIWDAPSGGNLIYNETFIGAINGGGWNVMLGFNSSYPLNLQFDKAYYKSYEINGQPLSFVNPNGSLTSRQVFYSSLGIIEGTSVNQSTNLTVSGINASGYNLVNGYLYATNGTYAKNSSLANYYLLSNPFKFWNSTSYGEIGNWSADKSSYSTINLLGSVGNWTADKSLYAQLTYVNSIGNWSANKSSYSTTSQANALYYPLSSNPSSYITLTALSGTAPVTYNSGSGAIGVQTESPVSGGTSYLSTAAQIYSFVTGQGYLAHSSLAPYFNSIVNFTGTLTNGDYCTYNSGTGRINCATTPVTNNDQLTNGANYITLAGLSGTAPVTYNSGTGAVGVQTETPVSGATTYLSTAGQIYSWVTGLGYLTSSSSLNANNLGSGTVPSTVISGSYTGITGVGTLTAGTWSAGTIAVAHGGTGTTTSTGTGSVVLSASPTFSGKITGGTFSGTFSGVGSSITSLNATAISLGTVPSARLSGSYTGITGLGTLGSLSVTGTVTGGTFSGNGASITSLNAGNIASGTLAVARGGTGTTTSTGTGNVVLSASPTLSGTITGGTFSGTFSGNGASITSLNAANIASGTLAVARGGTGTTTSTGSGSVVLSTSPSLTTPNIGAATASSLTVNGYATEGEGIVTSGNNSNGYYIEYADGTMIEWKNGFSCSVGITTSQSGMYFGGCGWTFPVAFASAPVTNIKLNSLAGNIAWPGIAGANSVDSTTGVNFVIVSSSSQTVTIPSDVMAIGRWE